MAFADAFNDSGGTVSTQGDTQKDLSTQCNGERTQFTTPTKFVQSSLKVYWNGIRQFKVVSFTITSFQQSIHSKFYTIKRGLFVCRLSTFVICIVNSRKILYALNDSQRIIIVLIFKESFNGCNNYQWTDQIC